MLNKKRIHYCTCPKCKYRDVDKAFRMTREEAGRLNGMKGLGKKHAFAKRKRTATTDKVSEVIQDA